MADEATKPEVPAGRPESVPIGRSGLVQYSGYVQEDINRALWGERGAKAFREMVDNSSVIGGLKLLVVATLRQCPYEVEPFMEDTDEKGGDEATKEDKERADFVRECFDDMAKTEDDIMSEICSMFEHGYAPLELTYKLRKGWNADTWLTSNFNDGKVGWSDWSLRAQETVRRWGFDAETETKIEYVEQWPPPRYQMIQIPREKFLLFRTTPHKDNPEGRSLIRHAFYEWVIVKRLLELMGIAAERDLCGIPVMGIPAQCMAPSASADQRAVYDNAVKTVENARNGDQAGIVLPMAYDEQGHPLYSFSLVTAAGTKQMNLKELIEFREGRMRQAVCLDMIDVGHEGAGSYALAEKKADVAWLICDALLDAIDAVINREAIPRLAQLNGWPMDRLPKRKHGQIAGVDLSKLSDYVSKLINGGAITGGDQELEDYLRDAAGLPAHIQTEDDIGIGVPRVDPVTGEPSPEPPNPNAPPKPGPAVNPEDEPSKEPTPEEPKKRRRKGAVVPAIHIHQGNTSISANPPDVTVNLEPAITVQADTPDVHVHNRTEVKPTPVEVHNHNTVRTPTQKAAEAPVVHVNVPPQATPIVNVTTPPAEVTVNIPEQKATVTETTITRAGTGEIKSTKAVTVPVKD